MSERIPPTPRQRDTLLALHNLTQKEWGVAPTMREIGEQLSISHVTVKEHLDQLVSKGLVFNHGNIARACEVTQEGRKFIRQHAKRVRRA